MTPKSPGPTATQGPFKQSPAHEEHEETAATVILSPKDTYDHIVAAGVGKANIALARQVTLGVLAGFYISFSFMLCITVGGQIPKIQKDHPGLFYFIFGSVGFPLGLTIIMVAGADLWTSSCMYMITAWIEGRVSAFHVFKAWTISWFANLAGCLIMMRICYTAELFAAEPAHSFLFALAHKKTSHTFGATVCRGIIANWLVNLAVWMANSARDVAGKAAGVYLPVSAFVTLGGEHVIANQFLLAMAKQEGNGMPIRTIVGSNFVPATIGNLIGGAFFVGTFYAASYGTLYDRLWLRCRQAYVYLLPSSARTRWARCRTDMADRLSDWLHWEAITAPSGPAPATPGKGPSRGLTSGLVSAPARALSSALAAASRKPALTPFERKRTSGTLGSDVV